VSPPARPLRPKDAATLIVLKADGADFRVLMGRRSDAHVFMPGQVVFPGGRVDRCDHRIPVGDELHPLVVEKLGLGFGENGPRRARAMALAAIRETFEETGVLIGSADAPRQRSRSPGWAPFLETGIVPRLAPLRLVARAITPPDRVRRFDARFFAVFADAIAGERTVPEKELKAPAWLTFEEARREPLPDITRTVLADLESRLAVDPRLSPETPVPFYRFRRGARIRAEI
jgi:8-oxo-dGTP pyrophosphatase MutT (NUDIX family)